LISTTLRSKRQKPARSNQSERIRKDDAVGSNQLGRSLLHQFMGRNVVSDLNPSVAIALLQFSAR
jgi:hypothetical protein